MPVRPLISNTEVFVTLSCHFILAMLRMHRIWNWSSFRIWCRYRVHVSEPYSRDVRTTARYTAIFVLNEMPWTLQRRSCSLPKADAALVRREVMSSSTAAILNRKRPKLQNLSTDDWWQLVATCRDKGGSSPLFRRAANQTGVSRRHRSKFSGCQNFLGTATALSSNPSPCEEGVGHPWHLAPSAPAAPRHSTTWPSPNVIPGSAYAHPLMQSSGSVWFGKSHSSVRVG